MARQVLDALPEPAEQLHRLVVGVEADLAQVALERILRVDPLEMVHDLGQPIDLHRLERQRLPHFPRRAAAAISDHVGGHGDARRGAAVRAVLLVHVLDDLLAPISARQIQIDVRPFTALFRQEALEQQIHPDRIDGCDAEAVAHRAVGRRSPPLHQDVVLAAVIDDVPDDQEVAGEIELVDEIELAFDLPARPIVVGPIALPCARLRQLAQERRHRLARRHRVFGEAVAEIRHRVAEAGGQLAGGVDRVRRVGEQARHRIRRLEIALGVARQPASRMRQRGLVADAGEDVVQRTIGRFGEAHPVGGNHRHVKRGGQLLQDLVVPLLLAQEMPLQLDVHLRRAEDADDAVDEAADAVTAAVDRGAAGERDQAAHAPIEILEGQRPFALRRTHLHRRHEPAQVAVAVARFDEDGQ